MIVYVCVCVNWQHIVCVSLMTSFSCSAAANANYSLMSDSATGNSTTLAAFRLVCAVWLTPSPSQRRLHLLLLLLFL